jgi:hypothetical protein
LKKLKQRRITFFVVMLACLLGCKEKQPANLSLLIAKRDFLLHPIHHREGPQPKEPHFTMVEIIEVKGSCFEDHVRRSDSYSGQIIRWQVDETREVSTFGHVTRASSDSVPLIQAQHPYYAPPVVDFRDIEIDTGLPKWTLHGVSSSEQDEDEGMDNHEHGFGYDSTCELEVVGRAPGAVRHENLKELEEGLR